VPHPKPILQNSKLVVAPGETVLIGTDQEVGIRYTVPRRGCRRLIGNFASTSRMTPFSANSARSGFRLNSSRMPFGFARDTANFVCPWRTR